jgi:hypothetical protein
VSSKLQFALQNVKRVDSLDQPRFATPYYLLTKIVLSNSHRNLYDYHYHLIIGNENIPKTAFQIHTKTSNMK